MKPEIRRIFAVFPLILYLVMPACDARSPDSTVAPAVQPRSQPPEQQKRQRRLKVSASRLEVLLHDRINQERRKHRLPTMRWDDALGRIASRHSRDMATNKYFSHTSPDGRGPADRYLRSGYACGITVNGVLRTGAENIFQLSLLSPASSGGEDAGADSISGGEVIDAVMRDWMDDRGDRRNILSPDWQREGIGISVGEDSVLYITLNFC